MDIETKRTIALVRLEKAKEDLASANALIQIKHWRGAVNRAYYAVFHLTTAVLLWSDIERSKHSAVQSALHQFLIKPGKLEAEFGIIFNSSRSWREDQDYSDLPKLLNENLAEQIIADAERFVIRLERYLREQGAIE